jgi:hypothetical protein
MAGRDRRSQLRTGMEQTLQRIRAIVESPAAPLAPPQPQPTAPTEINR